MKFSRLKKASDCKVEEWLVKQLQLNNCQQRLLREREIVRFSKFEFYERKQEKKVSPLWRISILVFPIFWLILITGLPFTMIITGKWGYGDKLYKFYNNWINRLGL
jgi:hypothetical protein